MKNVKRIISWILVGAILTGALPVQEVEAANGLVQTIGTDGNITYGNPSEEPDGGDATTEEDTTQDSTTQEPTTEEPTTEAPTTEQPAQIDETVYMISSLSPLTAKVIVIDPGHCKKHTGARKNGLQEENVVYDIATACQDKLNQYGDVTVYMTRDESSCCVELGLGDCLISRNNYSKMLDADFLVSMHINAGGSSGANVLAAYKSGYHDNIRIETQAFGKIVLQELKKLGIANRGFLLRKLTSDSRRYADGSVADYYSIVRNGVIYNIPSVIIEHGYVTSVSDCNKFFKTAAKRKKVGKADADAIISYYNLNQALVKGSFKEQGGNTYYIAQDGRKVVGWVKNDGEWYYFDEQGKMVTGFLNLDEDTFYMHPVTGQMITGHFQVGSAYYLAKGNGTLAKNEAYGDGVHIYLFQASGQQMKKGLYTMNGATYYVNKKQYAVTGAQKVNGQYYLFDTASGAMLYGYQQQNGKYYYLDPETGVMARNKIVKIGKKQYYFASNGVRKTGLIKYKKAQYYFNPKNGAMMKGWRKINKNYYYFDKTTGKMQKNKRIGKYYVNSKGIRTKKK